MHRNQPNPLPSAPRGTTRVPTLALQRGAATLALGALLAGCGARAHAPSQQGSGSTPEQHAATAGPISGTLALEGLTSGAGGTDARAGATGLVNQHGAGAPGAESGAANDGGAESEEEQETQAGVECPECGTDSCATGTRLRFVAHGAPEPDDHTPFDVSEVGGQLTLTPDYRACFHFKAPWRGGELARSLVPVVDNKRVVHSLALHASPAAPADLFDGQLDAWCTITSDRERVLLGKWTRDTPPHRLPSDTGHALPYGANAYVTLEVLYHNSSPGEPALDRSGVELCIADPPPRRSAGLHLLGSEYIHVPGTSDATTSDTCTPKLSPGSTSTLLAVTPWMHAAGRHARLELLRGNGSVEVLHDGPFDFRDHATFFLETPITIHPEDRLRTTCTHVNPGDSAISYGSSSVEEQCYFQVLASPPNSLRNHHVSGCWANFCFPGGPSRCIDTPLDALVVPEF